ncbi:MAG: hypothetical protein KKF44_07550 [Nanoarchaeota archaeon]|nr:hypothetical protein [Nanoarchaeota archaeon]
MAKEDIDEEVTIDFKKISKIFKKPAKKKNTHSKSSAKRAADEDITIDLDSAKTFIARNAAILIVLIPLLLTVYLRLIPTYLPITDDFATQSVHNNIRGQVTGQVNSEYPNLPAQNKNALIEERYNQVIVAEKAGIENAIKQNSEYLKSQFQDENGYTYLGDIDSYFYMRYARNLLEKGTYGDEVRDGKDYDTYMMAPQGAPVDSNLYPYIEADVFRITKFFNPKMTLMQAAFLTPLFLALIAVFISFLVGRKLAGNIGGFFASMLIATHPTILSRSLGSDNDIMNIVFPLLILFLFIHAVAADDKKMKAIYAALSGFFIGLYALAWSGWWYIFYFLIGSICAYLGYYFVYNFRIIRKDFSKLFSHEIKNLLMVLVIFLVMSGASAFLFGEGSDFVDVLNKPIRVTRLKEAQRSGSYWPNVYTTVAELNPASLGETIDGVGSRFFFLIALMGIVSTLVDFKKQKTISFIYLAGSFIWFSFFINNTGMNLGPFIFLLLAPVFVGMLLSLVYRFKIDIKLGILLIAWFVTTIYASTKGIRFILLLVPPFAVAFSIAIGLVYEFLIDFANKHLYLGKVLSKFLVLLLLLVLLVNPIKAGIKVSRSYIPHVNDGWYESLTKINNEASEDAIINSWWDFGHWFKFLADRRVTFDGASQNTPMAHWVGKALLTEDEHLSRGILRMLDCGSNTAYDKLDLELKEQVKSIEILNKIIVLDKKEAKEVLLDYIDGEKADEILSYTHCNPPENYFITSQDMVSKAGVWAHFGIWSFERARLYDYYRNSGTKQKFVDSLVTELGYSETDAMDIYDKELLPKKDDRQINDWIAAWPSFIGEGGCSKQEDLIVCGYSVVVSDSTTQRAVFEKSVINLSDHESSFLVLGLYDKGTGQKLGELQATPNKFALAEETGIAEFDGLETENKFGFNVLVDSDTLRSVVMSPELTKSMFTQLFYLEGKYNPHYERFSDVTDVQGQRIIVWKINWDEE